ncbi:uncharacterized protein RB166_002178 [Leptodactylus fuscus]
MSCSISHTGGNQPAKLSNNAQTVTATERAPELRLADEIPALVKRLETWSRGAPSFASNSNYTGQAFRRRNVVRFRHGGAKEDLPDRRFVVRELLCTQMGFVPTDILAVINLPDRQGYDVSFKLMSDLDRFWANLTRLRDTEGWDKFSFIPISRPDTASVTIVFWNEAVPPQDIVIWLRRHCDLMSDLSKNRDEDGVWTGGWRVLVKLRQQNNITQHLPNSFFIGREKGICFYAGQPRRCFKCGKAGHVASVCSMVKCSLCNEMGHVSATCQNIRCNLCGRIGHPHRDCPDAWHNICKDSPDEDLLAADDDIQEEEEALLSGSAHRLRFCLDLLNNLVNLSLVPVLYSSHLQSCILVCIHYISHNASQLRMFVLSRTWLYLDFSQSPPGAWVTALHTLGTLSVTFMRLSPVMVLQQS